jgi:DNA-binding IclR family transcriptional regulator
VAKASGSIPIQSIVRAVQILKCFAAQEQLGVTEISKMMQLHKSTTFGLVNTLLQCGLLEQSKENGKYRLGMELFRLGANIRLSIRDVCSPHLKQLVDLTGETVNLVMPFGDHVIYLDKVESPHSMRICTQIGQQYPIYCTAVGKALLAFQSQEAREAVLSRIQLVPYTANTIAGKAQLEEQLALVRQRGYAIDAEEMEYGLVCVAVPILGANGEPVASISVSGPVMRMSEEKKSSIARLLIEHAAAISRQLF